MSRPSRMAEARRLLADGRSQAEIARMLGISRQAVHQSAGAGRRSLRRQQRIRYARRIGRMPAVRTCSRCGGVGHNRRGCDYMAYRTSGTP